MKKLFKFEKSSFFFSKQQSVQPFSHMNSVPLSIQARIQALNLSHSNLNQPTNLDIILSLHPDLSNF